MRERLERAIRRGLVLSVVVSGCSGKVIDTPSGGGGAGGTSALTQYPKQSYPVCSGPSFGGNGDGNSGQCCVTAQCFTPQSGDCPPADAVGFQELSHFPPGSGSCGCFPDSGKAVDGPFAPRSDDEPLSAGSCCYLVAAIGCTGRPLLVAGAPRVASTAKRSDWASRPTWV